MHSKMTLVENLSDWLDNILELPYINVGDRINSTIQPKFFAFFDQQRSSFRSKVNVKRQYEFEKKMHMFPSLQERFLACQKENDYLKKIIDAYISILIKRQFSKEWKMTNKNQKFIGTINPKAIYREGHMIANHAVLQKKQRQLDKQQSLYQGKYRRLAIDYFGLITMNIMIGSLRHDRAWPRWRRYPQYAYLTKYTLQQLQRQIGPTRFMRILDYQHFKAIAQRVVNSWSDKQNFVAKNSFVDKFYIQSIPQDKKITIQGKVYTINPPVRLIEYNDTENINNDQWIQIPKHFWIIWDDGINDDSNINFLVRMCIQNLRKSAQNSGMQFHIVSNFTIKDYLSEQTYNRIQHARNNSAEKIWRQLTGDLWRLGLMYQHGGIYVDASTFTLQQNYDWVFNITRIPSSFIWNRYGAKPDVLMLWNDFYAAPTNWQFDDKSKTRKAWHLSYESNFIAAKKNSKFIQDWMNYFLQFVVTPQYQVNRLLRSSRAGGQIWAMRYLIIMDSMIYASLKKQQELQKTNNNQYANAADYYKLWSLNGYQMSHLKYRNQLNYQNKDYRNFYGEHLNIYQYERSQNYAQNMLGKNYFQSKFYTMAKSLNTMMINNYKNHEEKSGSKLQRLQTVFQDILHPDSLIGKYLIYRNTTVTKLVLDEYLHKQLKINQRVYQRFCQ